MGKRKNVSDLGITQDAPAEGEHDENMANLEDFEDGTEAEGEAEAEGESEEPKEDELPKDVLTEDANGANPTDTNGGELAEAAKPPAEVSEQDPTAHATSGVATNDQQIEGEHAGDDIVPTPNPEPDSAAPVADGDKPDSAPAVLPGTVADNLGVTEQGKPEGAEETTGADTASSASEAAIDDAPSTPSSDVPPEDSSEDKPATEPEMPALTAVHPEAKPIAKAAGEETMGKFKDAGNLLTEGLASLREIEGKLERLNDEAKARLAHLRHKASEALAALEAWFSRE